MKKVEKLVFLILVNVTLALCGSIDKGTKNSYTLEEKFKKEKSLVENNAEIDNFITRSQKKKDEINLRKLVDCDEEETGKGCYRCDNVKDTCSVCSPEFYLPETNNKNSCGICPNYCCKCTNSTYCEKCFSNYYQDDGQCKKCSNGCSNCVNSTTCNSCYKGFYESDGKCIKCRKNCNDCFNSTKCKGCGSNFYYENEGECIECSESLENCNECESSTICTRCSSGYYINDDHKCIKCSESLENCNKCDSSTICTECFPGYYINDDKCFKCSESLEHCDKCENSKKCINCEEGYDVKNDECIKCPDNCVSCDNPTKCINCKEGYDVKNDECIKCPDGCEKCKDSKSCDSCSFGYFLNTSSNECENCFPTMPYFTSNDNKCSSTCPEGERSFERENFYFCRSCSYLSSSFYNDEVGKCQRCPSNCERCSSFTDCTSCLYSFFISEKGECISSIISKGCLSDDYYHSETGKCERCLNGYELKEDGSCSKKTIPDTKFLIYGYDNYISYGKVFGFDIYAIVIQGLIFEAQILFDYKIKKYDNQNVETGVGICIKQYYATGDGNIDYKAYSCYDDDSVEGYRFFDDNSYYNNYNYFLFFQCEGNSTNEINPYDEITVTNVKLSKLNKEEVNNENIQSAYLLNYPLNKELEIESYYSYFYYSNPYSEKWYRFVAVNNKCTILKDNGESKDVVISFTGTIIDDEEINNLNILIPLYKLSSDESLNKAASCTLNKEANERKANMNCNIQNLNTNSFTLSKEPIESNDLNFVETYLTTYIENEAIQCSGKESSSGLSGGAIAGIVIGSVVAAGAVVGAVIFGITSASAAGTGAAASSAAAVTVGASNASAIPSNIAVNSLTTAKLAG